MREVRQFIGEQLAACLVVGEAKLLVSEIATNAVRYSRSGAPGGVFEVVVEVRRASARVAVHDDGGPSGIRLIPAEDGEDGRGLRIVDKIADKWGVDGGPAGRQVWFELHW